jgi:hypothetical protein
MVLRAAAVGVVLLALAPAPPPSDIQPDLQAHLSGDLKFSPRDLSNLESGHVVTKSLPVSSSGEVAVAGATRVAARRLAFADRVRDITRFKSGPDVLEIGRFSTPPALEDLTPLTITHDDLDLRNCRVGDCDVRLPSEAIARIRREIDWTAPDADARAAALYKRLLLDHVHAYLAGGGPGLIVEYDDDKRQVRPGEDFHGIVANSPILRGLVPRLPEHLERFPADPLEGAQDFLYWSKEKFGFSPFITVTQVTIAPPAATATVIASKDVYSSRYVDASLTVTVVSDAVHTPGAFYLLYVNRSRANALKGALAGLRRSLVERHAKGSLEDELVRLKFRLERGM